MTALLSAGRGKLYGLLIRSRLCGDPSFLESNALMYQNKELAPAAFSALDKGSNALAF